VKYFTDSVYEKMMMQKPRYGREKQSPIPIDKDKSKDKDQDKHNKSKCHREVILIPKERGVKE
jgi:hypothetical protein